MPNAFYPQIAVTLRVLWEDFRIKSQPKLGEVYTLPILVRNARVHINDYFHADTFECEIDYKSFPFDPRLIRSLGVTIHIEDMRRLYDESGNRIRIEPSSENAVFMGFADEESIEFDDTRRTVRFEGRDFTAFFLDRKYPSGTVNLERTIDEVIKSIVAQLPENLSGRITVDNRIKDEVGNPAKLPVLSSVYAEKDQLTGRKNVRKEETYWEVIQDICSRAGIIAYIELDKLVLTKPRVLYDKKKTVYFVYGKNLKSLNFKRKIGRRKFFNIVVRSLNIAEKRVIEAKIPAEATAEWSNAVGVPNREVKQEKIGPDGKPIPEENAQPAPYMAFTVPDVTDKDHLIRVGQEMYEEIGRQEIEGDLSTRDMETWHFNAESKQIVEGCFDLLKLRVGTPISVEIDASDMQVLSRMGDVDQRRKYLIDRCYDKNAADALARSLSRISTPFYTKAVEYSFGIEEGFEMKVDFINFIETSNKGLGNG